MRPSRTHSFYRSVFVPPSSPKLPAAAGSEPKSARLAYERRSDRPTRTCPAAVSCRSSTPARATAHRTKYRASENIYNRGCCRCGGAADSCGVPATPDKSLAPSTCSYDACSSHAHPTASRPGPGFRPQRPRGRCRHRAAALLLQSGACWLISVAAHRVAASASWKVPRRPRTEPRPRAASARRSAHAAGVRSPKRSRGWRPLPKRSRGWRPLAEALVASNARHKDHAPQAQRRHQRHPPITAKDSKPARNHSPNAHAPSPSPPPQPHL
jgi:hypothetical protein